jgi:hypothetical protein
VAGADGREWAPLLPAGFHDLDANARRRLCVDRFQDSLTRPRISTNLEGIIGEINRAGITGQIWVDGSYLTEKLNPDDADIALVISTAVLNGMTGAQRSFFDNFRTTSFYDQYKIDNYGIALDQASAASHWLYAYWLRQFGFSRSEEMKGILRVSVPFVVTP